MNRLVLLIAAILPIACKPKPATEQKLTLIVTADVHGVVEPCGCTSDILGDLTRVRVLAQNGLWLDGGNLFYDPETYKGERKLEGEVHARSIANILDGAELGAGAKDFAGPLPPKARLHAANVDAQKAPWARPPTVRVVNGVRVGVFGILDPQRQKSDVPFTATPSEAATRAVQQLRSDKADLIVALLGMDRGAARQLIAAAPGIDLAVFSGDVGDGTREPETITRDGGTTYLFAPADEARRIAKLELVLKGKGGLAFRRTADDNAAAKQRVEARLAKEKKKLAELKAAKNADPEFLKSVEDGIAQLERDLAATATAAPAPTGSWFSYTLVPVRRTLPRDAEAAKAVKAADEEIGAANLRASKATPPPAPEPGRATFVGREGCVNCHPEAVDFWKTTHHALAWKSLVDVGKQYAYDCVGCHVTGWQKPGGSHLASVEDKHLTDVQCENCHGPGSIHVAAPTEKKLETMKSQIDAKVCTTTCHVPEHSDTFQYEAYLRDITGKGHAEPLRKALGDGPTATSLRKEAMAKVAP